MKSIDIEVPDDLVADFERHAERTGRNVSELIDEALRLYLVKHAQRARTGTDAEIEVPSEDILDPGD